MPQIILLVLFVMTMFLWLLVMLGALPGMALHSGWLGFFACLFLGLALFLRDVVGWPPPRP